MGCDIHAVFQAKEAGRWVTVASTYRENRDYKLFAWLAGVRNRDDVTPISEPRGLPRDFRRRDDDKWMGDHSHSWLDLDEILNAPLPSNNEIMRGGIVSREFLARWDGRSRPNDYCQGIAGPMISVAQSIATMTDQTTHVNIDWPAPADEFEYFLKEARRLRDTYSEVRMVFGFDS